MAEGLTNQDKMALSRIFKRATPNQLRLIAFNCKHEAKRKTEHKRGPHHA